MSSKFLNIEILLITFRLKFGYSKLEHFWINCILEGWNSRTLPNVIFVIYNQDDKALQNFGSIQIQLLLELK